MTSQLVVTSKELVVRRLVTIRPEMWSGDNLTCIDCKDALVRLYPGAESTEQGIINAREMLVKAGAASVRTMPRQTKVLAMKAASSKQHCTVRQTVEELVAQSQSSDRPALKKLCNSIMDENGL